jgi:E3 ubiquitin-protein ligase makorin
MPANDNEKEQVLLNYKAHCATLPCKHFEIGILGSCSFGSDCFYAHLNYKGADIKSQDKTMQQLYEERRQGRYEFERERAMEYMAEMIMMIGLQRHLARRGGSERVVGRGQRDREANRRSQREGERSEDDDDDSEDDDGRFFFPAFSGEHDDDEDSEEGFMFPDFFDDH